MSGVVIIFKKGVFIYSDKLDEIKSSHFKEYSKYKKTKCEKLTSDWQ